LPIFSFHPLKERRLKKKLMSHEEMQEHIRKHGKKVVNDFIKGCKTALDAANVKRGDRIVIITDNKRRAIAETLEELAKHRGLEVKTIVSGSPQNPIHKDHAVMTSTVSAIHNTQPKVTFFFVDKASWPHRKPIYVATDKYGFTYTAPGIRHEDFYAILSGDVDKVRRKTKSVLEFVKEAQKRGGKVELHTGEHSVFHCEITPEVMLTADSMEPPTQAFLGEKVANLPGGEVETTFPKNVSGEIFFDAGSVFGEAGVIEKGITVRFENGKLKEMIPHSENDKKLVKRMKSFFDKYGYDVVEFAIGTNEFVPLELANTELTREKVLGTIHVGVGSEEAHSDLVAKVKHLRIAGKHIIKDGRWVLNHL